MASCDCSVIYLARSCNERAHRRTRLYHRFVAVTKAREMDAWAQHHIRLHMGHGSCRLHCQPHACFLIKLRQPSAFSPPITTSNCHPQESYTARIVPQSRVLYITILTYHPRNPPCTPMLNHVCAAAQVREKAGLMVSAGLPYARSHETLDFSRRI